MQQPHTGPVTPAPDAPAYRVRDFSPESRGSSFSATQPASWTPPSPGSEDLSYFTALDDKGASVSPSPSPERVATAPENFATSRERVASPPEHFAPPPAQAATHDSTHATSPSVSRSYDGRIEHTLTRRELRELRNHAQSESHPDTHSDTQSDELAAAMAEFDKMLGKTPEAPPVAEPTAERRGRRSHPVAPEPAAPEPARPEPVAPEPATPEQTRRPEPARPPLVEPEPIARERIAPEPVAPDPIAPKRSEPEPAALIAQAAPPASSVPSAPPASSAPTAPPEPLREVVTAPEVYAAPEGHWSNQAKREDDVDSFGVPHKRDLASSDAITTSALILPYFPDSGPILAPINGTGETLMTGSINLPRSLGVAGLHPSRYDRSDIDEIIDAVDREDAAPDSAPVRAVRAVSTYTSSQGIINARRPKGNNLPMMLSITAGVMMVGVVALVVAGLIFNIF